MLAAANICRANLPLCTLFKYRASLRRIRLGHKYRLFLLNLLRTKAARVRLWNHQIPKSGKREKNSDRQNAMTKDDSEEPSDSLLENKHRVTLEEALARLPATGGKRFATVFEHGSLQVEIYAPRERDSQSAHTRDEVYVVMRGSGEFVNGDERHSFAPGDFLFAPAGIEHRFENFTDYLTLWVIFYGPEGGEASVVAGDIEE